MLIWSFVYENCDPKATAISAIMDIYSKKDKKNMDETTTISDQRSKKRSSPDKTVTGFRQPKPGPALIVLGLAVLVTVGGGLLALAGSGQSSKNSVILGKLKGEPLTGESANFIIAKIKQNQQPPTDVTSHIVIPEGSSIKSFQRSNQLSLYNANITISIPASPKQVEQFFKVELSHDGWSLPSVDAPSTGSGVELLSTIPSSDSFYWGIGIVIRKTTPLISPALAGSNQNSTETLAKITIYEINDAS